MTPVKKPGKLKSKPESFRPMALICHMGKVMEIVVREDIQAFLEDNDLLTRAQHGFRRGKSCVSQLLEHAEQMIRAL